MRKTEPVGIAPPTAPHPAGVLGEMVGAQPFFFPFYMRGAVKPKKLTKAQKTKAAREKRNARRREARWVKKHGTAKRATYADLGNALAKTFTAQYFKDPEKLFLLDQLLPKRKPPTIAQEIEWLERQYLPKHDRADSWKDAIREVECDC